MFKKIVSICCVLIVASAIFFAATQKTALVKSNRCSVVVIVETTTSVDVYCSNSVIYYNYKNRYIIKSECNKNVIIIHANKYTRVTIIPIKAEKDEQGVTKI